MVGKLLHAGVPFAIYSIPGTPKPVAVYQNDPVPDEVTLPDESLQQGFYCFPFTGTAQVKGYRIRPENVTAVESLSEAFGTLHPHGSLRYGKEDITVPEVTRKDYIQKIEEAKSIIRTGRVEKIVLSRPVSIPMPEDFDPEAFFRSLMVAFPDLFSFFIHLPGIVTWAGATPELLTDITHDEVVLSALAGTRSGHHGQDEVAWSDKEKNEQEIVGKHIREVLSGSGFPNPKDLGTRTVWSGNLAHLQTIYRLPLPRKKGVLEKLICLLQPTPAVAGYPKAEALKIIDRMEGYNRDFYCGFLGPWKIANQESLFVNLRSVQITNRSMIVYAGGGITAGSDPVKEWEETEQKAQAMLSVLQKMSNFVG